MFFQIFLNSFVLGTQVLLLAVPLYLVYSVSKIYHLALGAIGTSIAYSAYYALSQGWSLWLVVLFVVFCGLILSIISYFLLESSARKREDMFGLLISFSFGMALESIIAIIFGTDSKFLVSGILPIVSFGSFYITAPGLITIIIGLILAIIFVLLLNKTPWGRNLKSVSENDYLASSLAINASRMRFYVFIVSSLLAGLIGILTVLNTTLSPQAGFNIVIAAFVALLVGGVYDVRGTIVASYIVILIPEMIIGLSGSSWNITLSWKMFILFLVAVALLWWRPNGLLSIKQRID